MAERINTTTARDRPLWIVWWSVNWVRLVAELYTYAHWLREEATFATIALIG